MQCTRCKSYAINPGMYGRDDSRKDLCDVCYWRGIAEKLEKDMEKLRDEKMRSGEVKMWVEADKEQPDTDREVLVADSAGDYSQLCVAYYRGGAWNFSTGMLSIEGDVYIDHLDVGYWREIEGPDEGVQ